jgi:competence protein ComEA
MPPSPSPPTRKAGAPPPYWLLRQTEQATAAILIAAGLLSVIGWWIAQGGARGRTVEIEQAAPQSARFQVDINKAEWPELATLPGVGRKLAERIVQSRAQDGPYTELDDLRRVRGIGARTLDALRPYLRPMPRREAVAGK